MKNMVHVGLIATMSESKEAESEEGSSGARESDAAGGAHGGTAQDPVAGKTLAEVLGEITWVMSQHPDTKAMPLTELERVVMPAIMLKQFHITYAPISMPQAGQAAIGEAQAAPTRENLQPVAVETFAMVSDAVATALDAKPDLTLTLQDWRSGPTKRVMLAVSLVKGAGG